MIVEPRTVWLLKRVDECIHSLEKLREIDSWDEYAVKARELAEELLYCTTEWEKYYIDFEKKLLENE